MLIEIIMVKNCELGARMKWKFNIIVEEATAWSTLSSGDYIAHIVRSTAEEAGFLYYLSSRFQSLQ